jgi:branched-chain amino acid transport system substrate-binding protein
VIGSISGWATSSMLAEAPILTAAQKVFIATYAAAPDACKRAGPYAYRLYPSAEYQGRYFADLLVNKQGKKNIAILYENEDYGVLLSQVGEAAVNEFGGKIVAKEAVSKDQTDLSAVVSKIKAANPEAVMTFVQYTVGAYFMVQADKMQLKVPVYGFDGIYSPEFIRLGGKSVEGASTLSSFSPESTKPLVADFVKAFKDAFGDTPNNCAGYAYDVANIIIQGINETNCAGGPALKQWMDTVYSGVEHPGITGTILIGPDRERAYADGMFNLITVKDGKWVEVTE